MSLLDLGWPAGRPVPSSSSHAVGRVVFDAGRLFKVALDGSALVEGGVVARPHRGVQAVVGDWVVLDAGGRVVDVLPRTSLLTRRRPGSRDVQPIAANVDVVLVVHGADRPPNPRRLERELALVYDAGAVPVVVWNKADVDEGAGAAVLAASAVGVEMLVVSATNGAGLDALRAVLRPRTTAALLGASGVGKSSLVNALADDALPVATGAVRADDGRGRHTTTWRELVLTASGALLVDGPGVRELGLLIDDDALEQAFDDVAARAAACRFRDCHHDGEPGCAVEGAIEEERLAAYRKLAREVARLDDDPITRRERRRAERSSTLAAWTASRAKPGR